MTKWQTVNKTSFIQVYNTYIPHVPAMSKHGSLCMHTKAKGQCSYVNYLWSNTHSLVPSYVWPYMALLIHLTSVFHLIVYLSACCLKIELLYYQTV